MVAKIARRVVACTVIVATAFAGSLVVAVSPPAVAASAARKPPKPNVPAPPAPAAVPSGTPAEQAAALAVATDQRSRKAKGGLPAILRAFALAGIPVVDHTGKNVSDLGTDIGGPPWWLVRMLESSNPDVRLTLVDVAKSLTKILKSASSKPADVAGALLADLRADAVNADVKRQFFAQFIAAGSRQAGGADPFIAATQPADVRLDSVAQMLVISEFVTAVLTALDTAPVAPGGPGKSVGGARRVSPLVVPQQEVPSPGADCNPEGSDEEFAYWAAFVASKVAGGVEVALEAGESADLLGTIGLVVGKVAGNHTLAGKLGTGAAIAETAVALAIMLVQMTSITLDGSQQVPTLERTKDTGTNGKSVTLNLTLKYKLSGTPADGGGSTINCFLNLLFGIGIQEQLPQDGGVPNTKMKVEGLDGFAGRKSVTDECGGNALVLFGPGTFDPTPRTDDKGNVKIPVQGCRQKKQKPKDATPVMKTYSIYYSSQLEEDGARTIANVFAHSFLAAAGKGSTRLALLVTAFIEIAKTFDWDLGEQTYKLQDWGTDYKLDGVQANLHWTAIKCGSLAGVWHATVDAGARGSVTTTFDVPTEPEPGAPYEGQTPLLQFKNSDGTGYGYEESFRFTIHADGDETTWAPHGAPAFGIDEQIAEGAGVTPGFTLQTGSFCKNGNPAP